MKPKSYFIIIIGLILFTSHNVTALDLKNGDLIFQESCSEDHVGNAIKNVTESTDSYQFTHVGIVYIPTNDNNVYIIEATKPLVRIVSLLDYLQPQEKENCIPRSIVGRLDQKYQSCIASAIEEGLKLIGKEYDYGFVLNNDKYYCSEFIYEILRKANNGTPIFELNIMTFKNKKSGKTDQNWIDYFKSKKLAIPEGELGINPGAMSRSDVIKILGEIKVSDIEGLTQ